MKSSTYYKKEGNRSYLEVTLSSGKTDKIYISQDIVPAVYAGWVHTNLATREELKAMGFTGKMILSRDGECWEHVQAKTMTPLNNMLDKHGNRFYIKAFTALDAMGIQLERRYQTCWQMDCFVRENGKITETLCNEIGKPKETFWSLLNKTFLYFKSPWAFSPPWETR